MKSAGINTDIHKLNSTKTASNTMFFKPGVPLEEFWKGANGLMSPLSFHVRTEKLKIG